MIHLPTPEELRLLRLKAGISQRELASRAGVSQTLIARIEKGDINPRLSTLRKIYNVLISSISVELKAKDIMHTPVITLHLSEPVVKAVELMDKYGISQIPVVDRERRVVGTIHESTILRYILGGRRKKSYRYIHRVEVKKIMDPPLPAVSVDTYVDEIASLLLSHPAVLVVENNTLKGIITKIDLVKKYTLYNFTIPLHRKQRGQQKSTSKSREK